MGLNALYDVTYFWLFVEFFVMKWSVRPRVRAFYFTYVAGSDLRCAAVYPMQQRKSRVADGTGQIDGGTAKNQARPDPIE